MNIKQKLFAGFGVSALVAGIASGFALHAINSLRQAANFEMQRSVIGLALVGNLNTATANMRFAQRGVTFFTLTRSNDAAGQYENFQKEVKNNRQIEKNLEPLLDPQEKIVLHDFDAGLRTYTETLEQVKQIAQTGDERATTKAVADLLRPPGLVMQGASAKLEKAQRAGIDASMRLIDHKTQQAAWIEALLLLGTLGTGVVLWFLVHGMVVCLRQSSSSLSIGAHEVNSAANQIAATSNTLAQNASREAAFLEETSASAEQITSVTHQTAERSSEAVRVMNQVSGTIAEANQSLSEMLGSMQEITGSSDRISKIIRVIEEIAFQTNILALNAAVEAARAGEAGMGFAVVADEVRNLAQRSAQAAKDTTALIEESIRSSQEGRVRFDKVSSAIGAITEGASEIKNLIAEIQSAASEQARGVQQISKAVLDTQALTQSTAASAEEGAASSEELNAQTATLHEVARTIQGLIGT